MPAAKFIRALLVADAGVTALVPPERIYPVRLPQTVQTSAQPALVIARVSSVQVPVLSATSVPRLSRDRVQVTAIGADYVQLTALCQALDAACTFARGLVAGVQVITTERALVGPDLFDDERGVYTRGTDFLVLYEEPQ